MTAKVAKGENVGAMESIYRLKPVRGVVTQQEMQQDDVDDGGLEGSDGGLGRADGGRAAAVETLGLLQNLFVLGVGGNAPFDACHG